MWEAIDDHRTAISQDPNNSRAYGNLAIALLSSGRTGEALAAYDRAIALADVAGLDEMLKDLDEVVEERGPIPGVDEAKNGLEARRGFLMPRITPGDDPGVSPGSGANT